MKAIDRIKKYMNLKGFNNSQFEKINSLSNGYIATQIKRKADLGESILSRIINNCLDINPEWLLTGKGSMIKDESINLSSSNTEDIVRYLYNRNEFFIKDPLFRQYIKSNIDLLEIERQQNKLEENKEKIEKQLREKIKNIG